MWRICGINQGICRDSDSIRDCEREQENFSVFALDTHTNGMIISIHTDSMYEGESSVQE